MYLTHWYIEDGRSNALDLDRGQDHVVVHIYVTVRSPITKGMFTALRDRHGTVVWSALYDGLQLLPGPLVFVHRFPAMPINPGVYTWDVRIFDGHCWHKSLLFPELSVVSKNDTRVFDYLRGIVNIDASLDTKTFSVESFQEA